MKKKKYALLDTDFISKTHLIRKDEDNKLIERIVQLPDYEFYCHEQIRVELLRHNIAGSPEWLTEQIASGNVSCYDDRRILSELAEISGEDSAPLMYATMLRTACEAYRRGYFMEQFAGVSSLDYSEMNNESFLTALDQECNALGADHNLGELKSCVLLQFLNFTLGQQIYVFCSDDRNARNGIVSIGNTRCISVLSSFLRLRRESGLDKEEAEPYIQSYLNFLQNSGQTSFRIQNGSNASQMVKIPCSQVFEELYSDKLEDLVNGNLKYI
jgi:hypothetical protein